MTDFEIYAHGIVCMSVCVDSGLERSEIERLANFLAPTGITSRWEIRKPNFASGEPNPCQCNEHSGRLHYLLTC